MKFLAVIQVKRLTGEPLCLVAPPPLKVFLHSPMGNAILIHFGTTLLC